jgi:hypothetical protein
MGSVRNCVGNLFYHKVTRKQNGICWFIETVYQLMAEMLPATELMIHTWAIRCCGRATPGAGAKLTDFGSGKGSAQVM